MSDVDQLKARRDELQSHIEHSRRALRDPKLRAASNIEAVEAEIAWINAEVARFEAEPGA